MSFWDWVIDLPCGCTGFRPSKKDNSPDKRFSWRIIRIEDGWSRTCEYGHFIGDKLPRTKAGFSFLRQKSGGPKP